MTATKTTAGPDLLANLNDWDSIRRRRPDKLAIYLTQAGDAKKLVLREAARQHGFADLVEAIDRCAETYSVAVMD